MPASSDYLALRGPAKDLRNAVGAISGSNEASMPADGGADGFAESAMPKFGTSEAMMPALGGP